MIKVIIIENSDMNVYRDRILEALINYTGTNDVLFYEYITKTISNDGLLDSFIKWLKKRYGKNYNVCKTGYYTLAKYIIEYYNTTTATIEGNSRIILDNDKVRKFGYCDFFTREQGKRHCATILIRQYIEYQNSGKFIKGNVKSKYKNGLKRAWNEIVAKKIADISGRKYEYVYEEIQEWISKSNDENAKEHIDLAANIKKALGGKDMDAIAKNLYALWCELNSSEESFNKFFAEILCDSRVASVRKQILSDTFIISNIVDDFQERNGCSSENIELIDFYRDYFIYNTKNYLGTYGSFTVHLGERIINYFNTLPKLISLSSNGENFVADTNNPYGIAETMDATQCANLLYGICYKFTSYTEMIKAIEEVSKTIKGFEAFAKLAKDLREDLDFGTELRTVFAKTVVARMQVRIQNGDVTFKQSNERIDRTTTLLYNAMNDARSTMIMQNNPVYVARLESEASTALTILKNAKYKINRDRKQGKIVKDHINQYDKALIDAKAKIIPAVREYYPSFSEGELLAYVELNKEIDGEIDQVENLKSLSGILSATIQEADKTSTQYNSLEQAKTNAIRHNAVLASKQAKGEFVSFKEYKDIETISKKDYLSSGAANVAIHLARLVEPYCTPQLQLTSANVFGNNSSDVINNNYLTNLDKILKQTTKTVTGQLRNPILEAWGRERLEKSCQFIASNILLEQYDEDGNVINDAIFRKVGGQIRLTEKGPDLLRIALFDGASNIDKGNNATYSKMQEGGYLPSAYMAFFNYIDKSYEENKPRVTSYFCRTPSDAPKNFMITASRVNTVGLLSIDSKDEVSKANLQEIISTILPEDRLDAEWNDKDIVAINETSSEYAEDDAQSIKGIIKGRRRLYLHKNGVKRHIKQIDKQDEEGNTIRYGVTKIVNGGVCFLVSGRLYEKGNTRYLYDTKVLSYRVFKAENTLDQLRSGLYYDYQQELINGEVTVRDKTYARAKLAINRKHPVFKQVKNAFRQEMINAAIAADHYFTLENDGYIGDGDATGLGKVIKLKKGVDNEKGYRFYHLDENGKVLSGDSTKGYRLGGAVFHSNRFTLSKKVTDKDGTETTIKENYFDSIVVDGPTDDTSCISILYGGANKNNYLHVKRDKNGKIYDVEFTKGENGQDEAIENKLEKFLIDYIQQSIDDVLAKKEFITTNSNTQLDLTHITEFAVNYFLFYVNSDDLFEGDTKFYLDSQTILKRAKEIQGSGVPYGIADYLDQDVSSVPKDVPAGTSFLNSGEIETEYIDEKGKWATDEKGKRLTRKEKIQDIFKGSILEGVTQRTGFYGITIKNTQMTNTVALEALVKQLVDRAGLTEDQARTILYGPEQEEKVRDEITGETKTVKIRKGGFQRTKVNDAQSYITIHEFVRRIGGRGQLSRYMPMLRKVIEYDKYVKALDEWNKNKAQAEQEGKEFTEKKPKEVYLTAADMTQFIQVQKNFYYDQYYDERYSIFVPRHIKNAEFVLVPCFIKGTELEKLYDLMIKNGIDQVNTVETSKAANEELITLWDNEGKFVGEDEFNKKAAGNKQVFSYKYLYTQQETPQHMNTQNKAGLQIVKKIVDNITEDNKVLWEKKQEYFRTFVQNIRDSYDDLMDELGVARDEDGFIMTDYMGNIIAETDPTNPSKKTTINKEVFFSKFRQELMRLGIDDNIIDYVTLDGDNPRMPSCMNNVLTKLESVAQSMFNSNITRQKLPGFHAAQVTNVGWNTIGDVVEKRMYDKNLKYHPTWYVNKDNPEEHISKRRYNELSADEKKQYKEDGTAPYIEVMLPASVLGIDRSSKHYKNMSDAEILRELEEKGLDQVIGYRIPTEGKCSACIMKIASFVDDTLGSTIIVPNDWVSQTGSDFDIDSVYGINFETRKNKKGEIFKVEYKNKAEQFDKSDWYRYILDYATSKRPDNNIKGKLKELVTKAKDIVEKAFTDIRAEEETIRQKLIDDLLNANIKIPGKSDESVKKLGVVFKKSIQIVIDVVTGQTTNVGKALYVDWCRGLNQHITNCLANPQLAALKERFEEYQEVLEQVVSVFDDAKEMVANYVHDGKLKVFEKYHDIFAQAASDGGLLSLEQFLELAKDKNNHPRLNSRRARNNNICQLMIDILSDPATLEENLSRSNFDDISAALKKYMDRNVKAARANRSAYNVFDQIKYQEDATSGMDLKGISVSLDTFCSICNTVRPILEKPIYVVYPENYNVQTVADRFGIKVIDEKSIGIRHDTYGWTKDNRNIAHKLLTVYSSETTPYSLDAIKEGAIPNVNVYTFDAFKTLLNVGSDYNTAIPFIMQPAIKRIVDANEAHNSVYATSYGDPIKDAIRGIATELGIEFDKSDSVHSILNKIENNTKLKKVFNDLFQQNNEEIIIGLGSEQTENLPIMAKLCQDRLLQEGAFKPTSTPVEEMKIKKLMFDLGVVLSFNKLKNTANEIGNVARCCNPDKFGAKQTLFSTNEVFQTIRRCLVDKNGRPKAAILTKDGMNILEAIYPGISKSTDRDPMAGAKELRAKGEMRESAYPTLNAYLKYASASAIIINRAMFPTQQPEFVNYVSGIANVLTNPTGIINEELYTAMQRYVLTYLQKSVDTIAFPIDYTLDNKGRLVANVYKGEAKDGRTGQNKDVLINNERARIYGFSCEPALRIKYTEEDEKKQLVTKWKSFTVKDVNKPTKEEVENFAQLSPAQKVKFIQQNFRRRGIFDYLDASLYNGSNRGFRAGMQVIEFTEGSVNNNEMFRKFNEAFYSNNVLVQMTAFDLIKYAITVEGLNMTEKGISKIIANTPLRESFEIDSTGGLNGTSFVDLLVTAVENINAGRIFAESTDANLYRDFLRSNKEVKGLRTLYLNTSNKKLYGAVANTGRGQDGTIVFTYRSANISDEDTDEVKAKKQEEVYAEFRERMVDAGIMNKITSETSDHNTFVYNDYIRVNENKTSRLYAIRQVRTGVVLYPLNNLERNECGTWSAKESNNKYYAPDYYEELIRRYNEDNSAVAFGAAFDFYKKAVKEMQDSGKLSEYKYEKVTNIQ